LRPSGATAWPTWSTGWCSAPPNSPRASAPSTGAEILNDVVFTQVCATFGADERTRAVTDALLADGVTWMSGSRWQGRDIVRVSVSNWSTDADDVAASVAAVRSAAAAV
jgi:hypothetical protein